jgi:hypothetical protein
MKPKLPSGLKYGYGANGERICTGAIMGRYSDPAQPAPGVKFRLYNIPLDSGGYDSGGAYWGIGRRVYRAESGTLTFHTRAQDRAEAKRLTAAQFPGAEFYR